MLSYLINKANDIDKKIFRPRVVVGIPVGVTNVEMRAVYDAAKSAGAREVYIVGANGSSDRGTYADSRTSWKYDCRHRWGTTDIAVIALGVWCVQSRLKLQEI